MPETKSFGSRFRPLGGALRLFHETLLVSLAILGAAWSLEIHSDLGIIIFKEQFLALIFTIGMVAVFLAVPARRQDNDARPPWYDWILVGLSILVGGFVLGHYHVIRDDLGLLSPERWGLGAIAVLPALSLPKQWKRPTPSLNSKHQHG